MLRSDIKWFHRDVTRQTNDYTGRGAMRTRTGVIQTGSTTAGIRAGKYTPDGTTNLRKILNKRCAQQKCLQKCVGLVKDCASTVKS